VTFFLSVIFPSSMYRTSQARLLSLIQPGLYHSLRRAQINATGNHAAFCQGDQNRISKTMLHLIVENENLIEEYVGDDLKQHTRTRLLQRSVSSTRMLHHQRSESGFVIANVGTHPHPVHHLRSCICSPGREGSSLALPPTVADVGWRRRSGYGVYYRRVFHDGR